MSILYRRTIAFADKFVPVKLQPLWNHEAVLFVCAFLLRFLGAGCYGCWVFNSHWLVKWTLVIAGLGDLNRPAELLSIPQSAALSATGLIWSRYSLVIIPKNWGLFSVNLFVALVNLYSLGRGVKYQMSLKENNEVKAIESSSS